MSYSPGSVIRSYIKLTANPDNEKVNIFIDTLINCFQRNDIKILTNADNFTVDNKITIIFDIKEFDIIFLRFDFVFKLQLIETNRYISKALMDNQDIHILAHIIFADNVDEYAKTNNCEIISFNESGIFNFKKIKQIAEDISKELIEFLYHPLRIEKHLTNGGELEDYLH